MDGIDRPDEDASDQGFACLWLEARERVEGLREGADRVLAELAEAETDWEGWVIARQRVGGVLAVPSVQESASAVAVPATDESAGPGSVPPRHAAASPVKAARAGSIVPVWRPGLEAGALAVEYQRILQVLTERRPAGAGGAMACQEIAEALGLEVTAAKVERAVRSRAKRLADRGWPASPRRAGSRLWPGQPPAHEHGHRPQHHRLVYLGQGLVVSHQPPRAHQPAQRPLHYPTSLRTTNPDASSLRSTISKVSCSFSAAQTTRRPA